MAECSPDHYVSMEILRRLEIFKDRSGSELNSLKGFHIFNTPALGGCSGGFGYFLLTDDDEMFGFGHNCEKTNILGIPRSDAHYRKETVLNPTRIGPLSGKRIQDISIGGLVGAALAACGTLLWWGLCDEDDERIMPPRSPGAAARRKFLRVSCGYRIMVALSVTNEVKVWGTVSQDIYDQRFFKGDSLNLGMPIVDISCGHHHLAMLDKDGFVHTWGQGEEGQRGLGVYSPDQKYVSWKVLGEPCSLVKCGSYRTYCLTKKFQEIYACGSNGECNISTSDQATPAITLSKLAIRDPITDLAIVKQYNSTELVAACTSESEFYTWGSTPYPVLTDASSMIEVFALWNMTPGLTHISCLPSVDSRVNDRSYRMVTDVLHYIYLKARPELAHEAETFFRSCRASNVRHYACLMAGKEKARPFMLRMFLADLTSKNQILPEDCTDFEEVENSIEHKTTESKIGFQNWVEIQRSQSNFSRATSNRSSRPRTYHSSWNDLSS